ncbi:hypothetical protein PSECIP111951_01170 [Pseudoalteromonas holothuriae]|uniref:Uncharacterized protein n=1 Tax=Pseudoalteromonas holothuriae TaxID=2963714 RepID=A0A9W4QXR4_9GAMM|nr:MULTISPECIES: hypothetical protein [unclassified Pseudoalteromonas]CAH9055088.1 hypothetical protein PSECIP111951_01170 [Pseudoalteromonas sp. CIP111951]CAH9057787.1 hypothetical protein PSECIP111854_02068 [Pseudoalteromonas sp. CIP111854]
MSEQDKTMTQRLSDVVTAADGLTQTVQDQIGQINSTVSAKMAEVDSKVTSAENAFDTWKESLVENINGINVYKEGNVKRFTFATTLGAGGWTGDADGPDSDYRYCANPQPPYFINMLEFISSSSFGGNGDYFKVEFLMTHRGMFASNGYTDHLIFTGTSAQDSVAGQLEIRKVANDKSVSVFISEPNNPEKEIQLTNELEGTVLPVAFRAIGQGSHKGIARIALKVDTRPHCGSTRAFRVNSEYTSVNGQPSTNRITQEKPHWES